MAQRPANASGGTDTGAAKIEILVLRAAIPKDIPARADSVVISPSPTGVSADSAALLLAAISKPNRPTAPM
jgi:hypothetical protein